MKVETDMPHHASQVSDYLQYWVPGGCHRLKFFANASVFLSGLGKFTYSLSEQKQQKSNAPLWYLPVEEFLLISGISWDFPN